MRQDRFPLPVVLKSYVAVVSSGPELERYFKSGSGKAFAKEALINSEAFPQGLKPPLIFGRLRHD